MSASPTGKIARDENYSPVIAFLDNVANEIKSVTPETPLPTVANFLVVAKTSELPRPSSTTASAGDLLGTSIAITGMDAVEPVAQVSTLTPANVNINDTFTAIINGVSISYVATAATVKNVVDGLVDAINNSSQGDIVNAENTTDSKVTITAQTAGIAFTITSSVVTGIGLNTQTLITSTTQANIPASPQIYDFGATPFTPHIDTIYKVVINGTTVSFTCTVATVANVVNGLVSAINNDVTVKDVVLAEAVDSATRMTITAKVAGTSFTAVTATAVAEVYRVTPAHVQVGDTFTVVINGTSIDFIATVATVANVTLGLTNAINGTTGIQDLVLAADQTTYLSITSKTAGTPFTCTSSATAGTTTTNQKTTVATTTPNTPYTAPEAQQEKLTPAIVEIGDIFTATINGHACSYEATEATVADVCNGLAATINLNVDVKDDVTAVDHVTYITIISEIAGTGFTCVPSTTDGGGNNTQTLTKETLQVNVVEIPAVAQVSTATPANVEIDDTFRVTINSHNVDFVATAATVANVVAGLVSAINADVTVKDVVLAENITSTYVKITAKVAGTAFTIAGSAIAGTGANNQSAASVLYTNNVQAVTVQQIVANQAAVAQVSRVTPTNVEVNDSFSVTVNGTVKTFVATVATAANVTAGLQALLDALPAVSASDQNTYVEIVADVAGTSFTISSTTINGISPNTQTLTVATTTPNTPDGLGNVILAESAAHGLTVDQLYPCTIAGVVGNTNANGNRMIKPKSTITFEIYDTDGVTPIVSNAAWISGGVVACVHYFKDIINKTGGRGILRSWRITIENDALITTSFTLFLYRSQPTTVADNAAKTVLYSNRTALLGYVAGTARQFFPTNSDSLQIVGTTSIEVASDTKDIYAELITDAGITIQASKRISIELSIEQRQSIS